MDTVKAILDEERCIIKNLINICPTNNSDINRKLGIEPKFKTNSCWFSYFLMMLDAEYYNDSEIDKENNKKMDTKNIVANNISDSTKYASPAEKDEAIQDYHRQFQECQSRLFKIVRDYVQKYTENNPAGIRQAQLAKELGFTAYFSPLKKSGRGENNWVISSIITTSTMQKLLKAKLIKKKKMIRPGKNTEYQPIPCIISYNTIRTSSIGESRLASYLQQERFDFIPQKSFTDCVGYHKPLPYDFYLPAQPATSNYVIFVEVQGKQHYEPVELFGGDLAFQKRQVYDKRKREYGQKHGKFMEIPYNKDVIDCFVEQLGIIKTGPIFNMEPIFIIEP